MNKILCFSMSVFAFIFIAHYPLSDIQAAEFDRDTNAAEIDIQSCDKVADHAAGALIGAALGDALGRVTEFMDTTEKIKAIYGPKGVTSFKSFRDIDWITKKSGKKIAAYTDDTVMAKIVLMQAACYPTVKTFIESLDYEFMLLFGKNCLEYDPLFYVRAHGSTNMEAYSEANNVSNGYARKSNALLVKKYPLYNATYAQEGGCGSVMRAWPLGLAFDNEKKIKDYADVQSCLTHRHPMSRAASVAIAVGVHHAFKHADNHEITPEQVVLHMVKAASAYDAEETLYKKNSERDMLTAEMVAQDKLLTSDMIRYASKMATDGCLPEKILGMHNKKQANYRSPEGFLLGWAADESVAAAVYVFLRHPEDLQAALIEAVNTPGDSDSIATLAGALVGAYSGLKKFEQTQFDYSLLEKVDELKDFAKCLPSE